MEASKNGGFFLAVHPGANGIAGRRLCVIHRNALLCRKDRKIYFVPQDGMGMRP